MKTPLAVERGDSAVLNCWYDLEDADLYVVKWYKNGKEFYRFSPKELPSSKVFPIGSFRVNKAKSNATQATLENLQLDAAGEYSCEVSADAPSFHTAVVYATIYVAKLPTQRPEIYGFIRKYKVGDTLRVNCTSGRSKPAANLTWYVNDRQPSPAHVHTYNVLDINNSEWQIAQTSLQFVVTHEHFTYGKLKIRCSASIYNLYWQSTEVSTEEERPKVIRLEQEATIVGINYLQPPPNFQTDQRKPDGHLDVRDIESSSELNQSSLHLILELIFIHLTIMLLQLETL
ncbi:cell adhesion molecule 3-like isoform X2 [Chelonus insularis]|nr:cell adhesion molecule 3-like isoform X2 [Chelonus insularis]XP_034942049.1 cell adhesion molecule 3-like isoform X2 [Chelonus insularis]